MNKKILLLSAYDARSHELWRKRLQELLPNYQWTQLHLPPRHFNWRIRGNSLQWAFGEAELLQQDYQLLIATSMTDLASLRGLVPSLANIPSVVYFHENQFAYPAGQQRNDNIEPILVPIYSALCADRIIFNSNYNRDSFLEGARILFQKLPDKLPDDVIARLEQSSVIPVPLLEEETPHFQVEETANKGKLELQLLWNHRWEYDKGIDLLLEVVRLICAKKLPIQLHIVGEQFRQQPSQFKEIEHLLQTHARSLGIEPGAFGFIEIQSDYQSLLQQSDVVLSTALHDFQGLAIQEACVAGCTPLTPDDLAYPEYLGSEFLYARGGDHLTTAEAILDRLGGWLEMKQGGKALPRAKLDSYLGASITREYEKLFTELK